MDEPQLGPTMTSTRALVVVATLSLAALSISTVARSEEKKPPPSSYQPVVAKEDFATVFKRLGAEKAGIMKRQQALLAERYDLANRPAKGAKMFRGKAV